MNAPRLALALAIASGVSTPGRAGAQRRAADLVAAARAQLVAGNADSGLALLRVALDSATPATTAERANALVWRGILQFFHGGDSLAAASFHAALELDPTLEVAGLAQVDSGLAAEFETVRRSIPLPSTAAQPSAALARLAAPPASAPGDSAYSCVPQCHGLDEPPRVLPTSPTAELVIDPAALAAAPIIRPGLALFRFTIDTAGAVEPLSVEAVTSPNPSFDAALLAQIRAARFAPGRAGGRAVRVLMQWHYSFRGR